MRATNLRLLTVSALIVALSIGSLSSALGQGQTSFRNTVTRAQSARSGTKTVAKARQPVGTPHKASAFAPRPTNRRVFGAPIQPPIVNKAPPPKH